MKARVFIVIILVITAAVLGRHVNRSEEGANESRDEIRRTLRLEPGALVEVRGISGSVEISTADTDAAEVRIVRTARGSADLSSETIIVDESSGALIVRDKDVAGSFWRWLKGTGSVRHDVTLTIPRKVELTVKGVNGHVKAGEVDGPLRAKGINGRVEMSQTSGPAELGGINGNVTLSLGRIAESGLVVKGVNGNVEIRLGSASDADIEARGLNGGLTLDVPNVTAKEREGRSRVSARLGAGGAPVELKGINGNVRFVSAVKQ